MIGLGLAALAGLIALIIFLNTEWDNLSLQLKIGLLFSLLLIIIMIVLVVRTFILKIIQVTWILLDFDPKQDQKRLKSTGNFIIKLTAKKIEGTKKRIRVP